MVFSNEDKILIKSLRELKGYSSNRFLKEFQTKNWTKGGLDYLLAKIDRSGSANRKAGSFDQSIIDAAIGQWRRRLSACVRVKGAHFEHKF